MRFPAFSWAPSEPQLGFGSGVRAVLISSSACFVGTLSANSIDAYAIRGWGPEP